MHRTAECCCTEISIEVTTEPVLHCVCNCDNCKKRTGSAFGISAYFNEENFSHVRGETSRYTLTNDFGAQERHFCKKCGTTLFWRSVAFEGLVGVAGGCFISPPLSEPSFIAQHESRCPWVSFSEKIQIGLSPENIPAL